MMDFAIAQPEGKSRYVTWRKIQKVEEIFADYIGLGYETKNVRSQALKGWFWGCCSCAMCSNEKWDGTSTFDWGRWVVL